jgi:hypothetical protein
MNVGTFSDDFTKDLRSFVKNPFQFVPELSWNPRKIAAPERHATNGSAAGLTLSAQLTALQAQNPVLVLQESLLQLHWNTMNYTFPETINTLKEQVWLFGYRWLRNYYDFLALPGALRSEFYRHDNARFLRCLQTMMHPNPEQRTDFFHIEKDWLMLPAAAISTERAGASDAAICGPSTIDPPPSADNQTQVSQPSVPQPPTGGRRLILKGPRDSAARNKTRKNSCN